MRNANKSGIRVIMRPTSTAQPASKPLPRSPAKKAGKLPPDKPTTLLSKRSRELSLIALAMVVLYLFICLFSYNPHDPGWSFSGGDGEIRNNGGRFGAWFADVMLQVFGYSAFLLPLILILLAWRIYKSLSGDMPSINRRLIHTGGVVATLLSFSGLEHLHFAYLSTAMPFAAGGAFGDLVAEWLGLSFGAVGATVILLTLLVAAISWATDLSWFAVMDFIGARFWGMFDRVSAVPEAISDTMEGTRVRKKRQASVAELRKEFETREPPRIEPQIAKPRPSGRKEKESQTQIFPDKTPNSISGLPGLSLLDKPVTGSGGYSKEVLEHMSRLLEKKLKDFNIDVQVVAVQPGPVITRFEIDPAPGVKASQIVGLSRDLARALSVVSIRVVENIPGKTYIGLELPNEDREVVNLIDGLNSEEYDRNKSPLTLVMGKDIAGKAVIADLGKMPHVLIAGTTGAGKSVCINALILSLVYKATPDEVRLIMVDPKMLELSVYDDIPHLLAPVVTDMQKAANALRWCIVEMDRRFRLMAGVGVRNIAGFNRKIKSAEESGKPIIDPLADVTDPDIPPEPLGELYYIVVVIDELADLMMVVGKKIEELITRIAQRARAAGIHLVLATQRPSVDVVTGLIKANVPTRVAFQVSSRADSRTVLDQMGAEQLLGHGDMLFLPPGTGFPVRVHGSFVSDQEVQRVADELRAMGAPEYIDEITDGDFSAAGSIAGEPGGGDGGGEGDPLYDQALRFVTETRRASISSVQRQLRVGYNRAARMIEAMEMAGVVGPSENGKRAVLAPPPPE